MNISDIIIDPEFDAFLPPLQGEELATLKAQIEREGFTDPLIVWQNHGELIDGHNRYRIWVEMGSDPNKAPDIVERKFADRMAVMEWMFHHQMGRRNMTPAQRAAVALKLKPAIEEKAKENLLESGKSAGVGKKKGLTNSSNPISRVNTRKQVAKIAGVSEDTVRKTEAVLKKGTPEVQAKMASGEISANQAFEQTRKISGGTKFDPSEWEDGGDRERSTASVVKDSLGRGVPSALTQQHATAAEIASAGTKVDQLKKIVGELADKAGGEFIEQSRIEEELKVIKSRITSARYWTACPRCSGAVGKDECDRCDGHGFIPHSRKNQLSDEDKATLGVAK